MAMCKRDWHFKLARGEKSKKDSDEIHFTTKPTASGNKESFSATYHKTFRKSFSEGGGEASTTLTSTNLRAEEDGMRVLAVNSTLAAALRRCGVKLTEFKSSAHWWKKKNGFTPEQIHRVCEHGVGRPVNLGVLLHGDAALDETHGCLQVAEGFAGPVSLRGHSTATRAV